MLWSLYIGVVHVSKILEKWTTLLFIQHWNEYLNIRLCHGYHAVSNCRADRKGFYLKKFFPFFMVRNALKICCAKNFWKKFLYIKRWCFYFEKPNLEKLEIYSFFRVKKLMMLTCSFYVFINAFVERFDGSRTVK